jgi:hypothetical protein
VLVARTAGHVIQAVAKKDGQVFSRTEYEVSSDGETLTGRAYDGAGTETLSIVFERR